MKPPNLQGCRGISMFPKGWKRRGTCVGVLGHAPFQVIESLSWGMPPPQKKRRSIIPDIFIQKTAKNSQQVCKSDHFWIAFCQLTWTTLNVYLSVSLVAWSHPCFTTKSLDQYVMDHHWMNPIFFRHKSIGWSGDSKRNSCLVCFCCVWCSSYWSSDDHICQICPAAQSSNLQVQ